MSFDCNRSRFLPFHSDKLIDIMTRRIYIILPAAWLAKPLILPTVQVRTVRFEVSCINPIGKPLTKQNHSFLRCKAIIIYEELRVQR